MPPYAYGSSRVGEESKGTDEKEGPLGHFEFGLVCGEQSDGAARRREGTRMREGRGRGGHTREVGGEGRRRGATCSGGARAS